MNKIGMLLKIQLLGLFNINSLRHGEKKDKQRAAIMGGAILLLAVIVIGYSTALSISFASLGMADLVPALMLTVCALITLFLTLLTSGSVLFGFRDYDLVMSMPVKSTAVIISRLLTVYLTDFLFTAAAVIPSMIVFASTVKAPTSVWLMMAVSLFLAPLLPMIAAMLFGAIITAVAVRFKHTNILVILLSVAATIAAIGLPAVITPTSDVQLAELGNAMNAAVSNIYPPADMFRLALTNRDWGSFGMFLMISVIPTGLFIGVLSKFYIKINSALFTHRSRSNYRMGALKVSTPFKALYIKELRRLFSSPMYFLNSSIGMVLLVVTAISLLFVNVDTIDTLMEMPGFMAAFRSVIPLAVCFFLAISSTTSSAMSMEGKSRWIPLSMPIEPKTMFDAKIAANLTVDIPAVLISGMIFTVGLGPKPLETIFLFVTPCVFACFIAVLGLVFNLKFPKYDWANEQQAVKQSISVILTLGVGALILLIPLGAAMAFRPYTLTIVAIMTLLTAFVTMMLYERIKSKKLYFV